MDKFDEYRFFAESTQHLSERRQAATQTYLAVNTAVIAILGFFAKDSGLTGDKLIAASIPLFFVGIIACSIWYRIIIQYKRLIKWRYDQLMEMERAIPESHQMYIKEWEELFKPIAEKNEKFGFSILEKKLPILFIAFYAVYALVIIIARVRG